MKQGALFLDRDGIVNIDLGFVSHIKDFVFRDGIFELCSAAQMRGMALVIVTNQSGIGRGYYTEADFHSLTDWMLKEFIRHGICLTAVEFCPDHPTCGIGAYRRENSRRKPSPGMILDACVAYGLDPKRSVMVGDRTTDMQAALAAGIAIPILLPATAAEIAPCGAMVLHDGGLQAVATLLARIQYKEDGISISGFTQQQAGGNLT